MTRLTSGPAHGGSKSKQGRASKRRSKQDERDVARILGGKRHPADIGGLEDVEHPTLSIQVKGGRRVVNETIREAVDAGRAGAVNNGKLGCAVLVDRGGTRIRRYIVFELEDWADHEGWGS